MSFFYGAYIEFAFCCCLGLYALDKWDTWGCWFNNITVIMFIPLVFVMPFVVGYKLWKHYDELWYPHHVAKYGALYEDMLLFENRWASLQPFIYMAMRLFIALLLTTVIGEFP